jgi:alkylhydroperoxidase/carboxymuconolactone decarboxylase family protein YurZ
VANHCPGCIGFHSQTLVKLQATREELLETLSMAIYMGGGPSLMYAAEALEAFEEFGKS